PVTPPLALPAALPLLQNANDPPHYTNLRAVLAPERLPVGAPEPRLRLRSQLSLQLVEEMGDSLTLEDVVQAKHDLTMLAAKRLKDRKSTRLNSSHVQS